MTEFTIMLSDSDTDLLFQIKEALGLDDLTGNEFAACLLEAEMHRRKREYLSNRKVSRVDTNQKILSVTK